MKKRFFASMGLAVALALGITAPAFGATNVASVGDRQYETLQAAIDAAQSGETIVLNENVTTGAPTFSKEGVYILDLNGKAIEVEGKDDAFSVKTGNIDVTVKNGAIKSCYGAYAYNDKVNKIGFDSIKITIDGMTIDCDDQTVGVQGMNTNQDVLIKDSILTSGNVVVYYPTKSGTLTIENSTLQGVTNGIVAKGGNIVINEGSVISATGERRPQNEPYPGSGDNFPMTGDAIYVEGGYRNRPINVTINGGTFTSVHAEAVNMAFTTGEYEATEPQKTVVNGGSFSSLPSEYMPKGRAALAGDNGSFTVMTEEKAEEAGLVSVEKDGVKVYFTDQEEAEKFAVSVTTPGEGTPVVTPVAVTVTFEDGSDKPATVKVDKGNTVAKPADPEREGYVFKGWYADKDCTTKFKFDTIIMADTTVYAKWEKTPAVFKVTFNDGFDNKKTVEVVDGDTVAKPADPTHDGYAFEGWYTTEAFAEGSEFDFATEITTDLTLWAKWKKVEAEKPATEPEKKPESKPGSALPQTGDASMLGVLAAAGAGVVLTGAGFVATRKKK